jgi:type IX secretion system PorP/SprF family membrane protein
MIRKISLLLLVFLPSIISAQQLTLYSQYMTNEIAINPAVAGTRPYSPLQINSRNQWASLGADAPITNTLSFHSSLGRDSEFGLGGLVFQESTGPYSQLGVVLSYAYHVSFGRKSKTRLSFGLSGTFTQHSLNQDQLEFHNPDPEFEAGQVSSFVPDAGFGLYLSNKDFYAGASVQQLFESTFREASSNIFGDNDQVRHFLFHAGVKNRINNDLYIEPSILIKTTETSPMQLDLNARVVIKDAFWTGLSLRTSKSAVVLIGANFGTFTVGYGFDYSWSSIGTYTSGSHEISLGFNIPDKRFRRHSYYW